MPTTTQTLCYNCFQQVADPTAPCPYCGFDLSENRAKFPVALPAGTVLNNRYIVGRVLGQGGFGITYVAFDTQLQAKVAVKEYMPGEMATRTGTTVSVMMETKSEDFTYGAERFQEEARTLAKFMGHPNIAGVSSYFDENGTSYFVMDYIEGVSFKNYIANNGGKVSVDETLNVMIPVLRALTAVHAEGFIHRDVTPDNIYISKDGNVKLLDFGSARYSIGDKSKSLDVILKVGYAPKEQYIRRGRQGPYTDVYSCAACFYAALTGYLPPESLDRLENDTLTPVSQGLPDIPEWLDKAILKGLAVQPEDRFQSAAEFLDAIENQLVVEVPAAAPAVQPAPPERKKPKTALIAGVAAALVIVVGVGAFRAGRGGTPQGTSEPPATPSAPVSAPDPAPVSVPEPETAPEPVTLRIGGEEHRSDETYLSLWQLDLTAEDIEAICRMENLEDLTLYECYADDDFAFLPRLTGLKKLSWTLNNSKQLDNLAGCTQLTSLQFGWGSGKLERADLNFLAGLTELEELYIHIDGVEDSSGIANLTKLTHLTLAGQQKDFHLDDLAGMTEMEELALNESNITHNSSAGNGYHAADLSFMSGMTKLTKASMCLQKSLGSLAGLEGAVNLRELDLEAGSIPTLEPMAALISLRSLRLVVGSRVSLEPLRNLEKLEVFVTYSSGRLTDWNALDHVPSVDKRA